MKPPSTTDSFNKYGTNEDLNAMCIENKVPDPLIFLWGILSLLPSKRYAVSP